MAQKLWPQVEIRATHTTLVLMSLGVLPMYELKFMTALNILCWKTLWLKILYKCKRYMPSHKQGLNKAVNISVSSYLGIVVASAGRMSTHSLYKNYHVKKKRIMAAELGDSDCEPPNVDIYAPWMLFQTPKSTTNTETTCGLVTTLQWLHIRVMHTAYFFYFG